LLFNPNEPASAPGPKFVAVARTTVGTIPGNLTLTHGIFEVPTGFRVGLHTHDGWSIVTELSGGHVINRVNGVVQPGATFVHGPNDVHDGEYNGGTAVMAMFASVGPVGAPPSRPLITSASPATAAPAAIRPPATGDGGLAAD
jgi:quercetin dioxygenase-like cupin family protein